MKNSMKPFIFPPSHKNIKKNNLIFYQAKISPWAKQTVFINVFLPPKANSPKM